MALEGDQNDPKEPAKVGLWVAPLGQGSPDVGKPGPSGAVCSRSLQFHKPLSKFVNQCLRAVNVSWPHKGSWLLPTIHGCGVGCRGPW